MITIEKVVSFAIQDPAVLDLLGEALRSDLVVANPYYRQIATFADDFYSEKRKLPQPGDWEVWLSKLPEVQRSGIRESLGRLQMQVVSDADPLYFGEQVIDELKGIAAATALARMNSLQDGQMTAEVLETLADQVKTIQGGSLTGLADLADYDLWISPGMEEDRIPTGFPTLDKYLGGWQNELIMIFADSGVGKSMFLQNVGANCAAKGKRVVHVTLELGLRPLIHRYYRQIAQAERKDLITKTDEMKGRLRHWFQFSQGELLLLEYPAYSQDPRTLQRAIERLNRQIGDVDVIIIDYLDLMVLPPDERSRGRYEDLGKLTHMLRNFCTRFSAPVFTASQAVRRPNDAARLSMKDLGDSYEKARGVDLLMALQQDPEEEETHQGRLSLLKVRDSGGRGEEVNLYINKDLALIQDLHHPNTIALMGQLGHQPVLPPPKPQKRQ